MGLRNIIGQWGYLNNTITTPYQLNYTIEFPHNFPGVSLSHGAISTTVWTRYGTKIIKTFSTQEEVTIMLDWLAIGY